MLPGKSRKVSEKNKADQLEKAIKLAQSGEVQAFGVIYDLYVQKVYRYLFFKVGQEDALDITETVFLKAWENISKYQARPNVSFAAWLFRIAHNLLVDFYRQNKVSVELDASIPDTRKESDPSLLTDQSLTKEMVRSALSRLKKGHQEVLSVCFLSDLDNLEAAKVLNKSEGALRVLKFRALQELKTVLLEMGYQK